MRSDTATALTMTRTFGVPVQQLFDAWTDPAQVTQWMGPGEIKCVDVQMEKHTQGWTGCLAKLTNYLA